jgi:hypothetical protein
MPLPEPDGLIDLLQTVGGWDAFEVARVTTEALHHAGGAFTPGLPG